MSNNNFEKMIRDTINFGAGVFSYSKELTEEFVDKMVEKGEISRYEADNLVSDILKKSRQQKEEIKNISKEAVAEYLDLNEYVKKSDIDEYIKLEVERLLKEKEEKQEE